MRLVTGVVTISADDYGRLLQLVADARAYVEIEAKLENSGMGRVVGNPAKKLLREIDEALGNGGTK